MRGEGNIVHLVTENDPPMLVESQMDFAVVPTWVLTSDLSPRAVHLYCYLRSLVRQHEEEEIRRAELATVLRCSREVVDKALDELVENGVISYEFEPGIGGRYRTLISRPDPNGSNHSLQNPTQALKNQALGLGLRPTQNHTSTTEGRERVGGPGGERVTVPGKPQRTSPLDTPSLLPDYFEPPIFEVQAVQLCNLLRDLMMANGHKPPVVTSTWIRAAVRTLQTDRRPYPEAEALLRWSQQDEWWMARVLSPAGFRRNYDRVRLDHRRRSKAYRTPGTITNDQQLKEWLARSDA